MTKRLKIEARQRSATTATMLRFELINLITFFGRNQLSKMSPMPRLSAPLAGCRLPNRRRRASCCTARGTGRRIRVRRALIFFRAAFSSLQLPPPVAQFVPVATSRTPEPQASSQHPVPAVLSIPDSYRVMSHIPHFMKRSVSGTARERLRVGLCLYGLLRYYFSPLPARLEA
jgi:hypothetical protein